MTDLPESLRKVFEAIRPHTEEGITIAAICRDPEVKKLSDNEDTLRSYVNFATDKLASLGYIRTFKSSRPKSFVVDESAFEKIVVGKVQEIATNFFRGDIDALMQFVHATVKKGSLR